MITQAPEKPKPERLLSETFAKMFRAYMEASDQVQEVIRDMCAIINDSTVDPDDCEAAFATLIEALFPMSHNGEFGIDLEDLRTVGINESDEIKEEIHRFDREQDSFVDRLLSIMKEKGLTQNDLAAQAGVGQSAISMMLSRKCYPQRRTVERLAKGLDMSPDDLWIDPNRRDATT